MEWRIFTGILKESPSSILLMSCSVWNGGKQLPRSRGKDWSQWQNTGKKESNPTQGNRWHLHSSLFNKSADHQFLCYKFMWSKQPKFSVPMFWNSVVFHFLSYLIPAFFSIPIFWISSFQTDPGDIKLGSLEACSGTHVCRCLRWRPWPRVVGAYGRF